MMSPNLHLFFEALATKNVEYLCFIGQIVCINKKNYFKVRYNEKRQSKL